MSAIAGILTLDHGTFEAADPAERMAARTAFRGPDDEGSYRSPDGRAALAARRLAVMDPSDAAGLPLANETHDVWLVLDGEITNHRTLRHSLELVGHRFRSGSDAEVALHAYEQWELGFLSHLQGGFALGLWDDRRDRLVLARDRMGRKPLYLAEHNGRLAFASHPAALLEELRLERRLDPDSLTHYLAFGWVPAPRTLLAGVSKLAAGEILVAERGAPPRRAFWGCPVPDERRAAPVRLQPVERHLGNLRTLLECSVADRLVADGTVGVALGPDPASGAMAAIASRLTGRAAEAVAVVDAGALDGEAARDIRLQAAHGRVELAEFAVDGDEAAQTLPGLVERMAEPAAHAGALPAWFVSRAGAEAGMSALLLSDGAEEILLSHPAYDRLRLSPLATRLRRLVPPPLRRLGRSAPAAPVSDAVTPLGAWTTVLGPAGQELLRPAPDPLQPRDVPAWMATDRLAVAGLGDLTGRVAESLCLTADGAVLSHGIEARLPFLDEALVGYSLAVPGPLRGPIRIQRQLLRRAISDLVPPPLAARPAAPEALPLGGWLAGGLGDRLEGLVEGSVLFAADILSAGAVQDLLRRHRAEGGQTLALWSLLVLAQWVEAMGVTGLAEPGPARHRAEASHSLS